MRQLAAVLSAALATTAAAQEVPAPPRFAAARAKVLAEVEQGNAPSIAVAVLEHGEVVWAEGFGHIDVEHGHRATADSIYRLASISKTFTATALMQLAERGLVDLDAPANRYLDVPLRAYRGTADAITLRRLANHTSGLPTHWNFFYEGETPPSRAESIRAFGFAAFEPGTQTNYSNFAFGVLDHVIARIGKAPGGYRGWLVRELLDPLGMVHTDVGVRPGQERHAAVGYRKEGERWVAIPDYGFDHDGASAVRSSANDLMRWARVQLGRGAVDGHRVLREDSALAMREKKGTAAGSAFGVGWSVGEARGAAVLRHSGGMPGVSTEFCVFPDRDAAVAVLTNCADRDATGRALDAVFDVLLGPEAAALGFDSRPWNGMGKASYRGLVVHPDGPIALHIGNWVFGPNIRLGDRPLASVNSSEEATRLELWGKGSIALGHPADTADLRFELETDEHGARGVLYATVDGLCRLPFWCELGRVEPKPANTLRVVTYNVLEGMRDAEVGRFLPGYRREAKIAAWLAAQQPDVVALQEMNGFTDERLRRLAAVWGHPHVALLKEDGYPVAITSSTPLTNLERRRDHLHHGMLRATTRGIDFIVVHYPPQPGVEAKLVETRTALALYGRALLDRRPAVVLGDCNSIARTDVAAFSAAALERYRSWGYALADGQPAEFALDMLLDTGAVDIMRTAGTPPDEWPLPRIDFVLASPDLAAGATACRWLTDGEFLRWSDHPPVVADFRLPADAPSRK
ncbi:MAG: serine hydrolase [Planctomycetota bacterium]